MQGAQFTSHLIENILRKHKIKHRTSTTYHPQASGQVELTSEQQHEIMGRQIGISYLGLQHYLEDNNMIHSL